MNRMKYKSGGLDQPGNVMVLIEVRLK